MRFKRLIIPVIIAISIWVLLTVASLMKPGLVPYFFDPECVHLTIDANAGEIDFAGRDFKVDAQNLVLTFEWDSNLSIRAISPLKINGPNGPVLDLDPGERETFHYVGKEAARFALTRIQAKNASISLTKSNGQQSANISKGDAVEISAYYDPEGDIIPVWLSTSATIEIVSTSEIFGMLYVTPQDPLITQELFEVTNLTPYDIETSGLVFVADAIQGNSGFKELLARRVDGAVEADKNYVLSASAHDAIEVKSCSSENNLYLSAVKDVSTIGIQAQEIYGRLRINGFPTPESPLENIPRSGIASAIAVTVIILTILLEKYMISEHARTR